MKQTAATTQNTAATKTSRLMFLAMYRPVPKVPAREDVWQA